jgi:hypothetical protein
MSPGVLPWMILQKTHSDEELLIEDDIESGARHGGSVHKRDVERVLGFGDSKSHSGPNHLVSEIPIKRLTQRFCIGFLPNARFKDSLKTTSIDVANGPDESYRYNTKP